LVRRRFLATFAVIVTLSAAGRAAGQTEVKYPVPDVPQMMTLQGQYVRLAYNNEGYAVMGYRMAQQERGNPWILLNAGFVLREGVKDETLKKEDFTIKTPDGKIVPLPTWAEVQADHSLRALNERSKKFNDNINYFPVGTKFGCAIQFFPELTGPGLARDEFEISDLRACVGRLYFKVPGGIQVGQYWLNVKFAGSTVQVPFRIFTDEQEKEFKKRWEKIKKDYDELTK